MPGPIRKLARRLTNVSLASLWQAAREPRMTRVRVNAPPATPNHQAARFLFPAQTPESIERRRLQFVGNHSFFQDLDRRFVEIRQRRSTLEGWLELMYLIVRLAEPEVMLETGVFDGTSSAVILQALEDNRKGRLISIDLPAVATIDGSTQCMRETCLPAGFPPGWVVPNRLKSRHRLVLGDSRELLPRIFREEPRVDVFFHDSLHTFDHMSFEYKLAWDHLPRGGLLLSDDIFWSAAFHEFCEEKHLAYVHTGRFGAVRKA